MDKDVLSIPYGNQLATPDLSPQELNFSIDVINTLQDDASHANVISDLVSKVSLLEQTVLDLQRQVKQPHRETKESTTPLQVPLVLKPRVTTPSQMQIKQPKIQERIKYFELLHQREKAINNRHDVKKDKDSSQPLKQVSMRQPIKGLDVKYDGSSDIRPTMQPTDSGSAYESRFKRLEIAFELLQQKLDTIDLAVKRLKSEGGPEPVIRVKVKKSQLEKFGDHYTALCRPRESLDSKTRTQGQSADQIGVTANTVTNDASSASLSFQCKPFSLRKGPLRQRKVGSKCHVHAKLHPKKSRKLREKNCQSLPPLEDQPTYTLLVSLLLAMLIMVAVIMY